MCYITIDIMVLITPYGELVQHKTKFFVQNEEHCNNAWQLIIYDTNGMRQYIIIS